MEVVGRRGDDERRFWWVNHNATHAQERHGGFIWAPKVSRTGRQLPGNTNVSQVQRGDIIFSYAEQQVGAVGVAASPACGAARPAELSTHDEVPSDGWRADVAWHDVPRPVRPKDHWDAIQSLVSRVRKPWPLNRMGKGEQGAYLCQIGSELAAFLMHYGQVTDPSLRAALGESSVNSAMFAAPAAAPGGAASDSSKAPSAADAADAPSQPWDEADADEEVRRRVAVEEDVLLLRSSTLPEATKEQLLLARRGYQRYREQLLRRHPGGCPLTQSADARFLVASHIKPWRDASNAERLDPDNGLLLAPHIGRLFDRGWITFLDCGTVLWAEPAVHAQLEIWGLPLRARTAFSEGQKRYLAYHRTHVFEGDLAAAITESASR